MVHRNLIRRGRHQMNSNSPLEHLAAFAITFALGMVTTAALSAYTLYVKRSAACAPGR